ncbi:MAG: hypothetical protein EZS28_006718 [Streblomastix strix]|uniref:Uncharacterized protein n=1 Tax=Streblomastix strix TaxID=222440 RepID=A0A5J4WUC8_9EUKA|nr:MAG: hypothetical protein EZS28_006718 [Streblomastix strix]
MKKARVAIIDYKINQVNLRDEAKPASVANIKKDERDGATYMEGDVVVRAGVDINYGMLNIMRVGVFKLGINVAGSVNQEEEEDDNDEKEEN